MVNKESGGTTVISDKIEFWSKSVTRNYEGHYIVKNGSTHQENIIIYMPQHWSN